ncbi:MAG: efflux RND transporter permease subunit, partial [Pseudomonadota bacterium]
MKFALMMDMDPIFDDLRKKVEDVAPELPDGVITPAVNDEFGDVFGSVYALTGDGFSFQELGDIAEEIRDELLKEPDIAKVDIDGMQDEIIYVEYNNAQLTKYNLTPRSLTASLSNVNVLSAGGNILSGRERIALEPTGNFNSVEELSSTLIDLGAGNVVHLDDIAIVRRGYVNPPTSIARSNGEPSISVSVSLREGGDILKLGERLNELIPQIENRYPWGIKLTKIWFQADLVTKNVDDFTNNLLQAIGIVILVMIAFLGIRTGVVVATLIPSTIIITFFLMQVFGITINQVSLAALIIALGLLVDNAIVIVESILVKRERGASAIEAAVEAGNEMKAPLLVSSLTTGAAFLPITLAESAVGEYTSDIFSVVVIALLTSWVLAMTFVPMVSTKLLRVESRSDDDGESRLTTIYRPILELALRFRAATLGLTALVFVLAIMGMGLVPQVFIPPSNDPIATARLEMPLGTSIETTSAVTADLDNYLNQSQSNNMDSWLTYVGDGGPRFHLSIDPPNPNPANAFMILNAENGDLVPAIISDVNNYLTEAHPDLDARVARLENGPPVGYPITIRLTGPDVDTLHSLAGTITARFYEHPGVTAIKNDWGIKTKKLIVRVDQDRARRASVTNQDVAYSLQTSLTGVDMTEYREGTDVVPVRLRSSATDREDVSKLYGLSVFSSSRNQSVPLTQVADIELAFEPGLIKRRDRSRTMTLNIQLRPDLTATEVSAELIPWLNDYTQEWPSGYSFEQGGEAESSGDANAAIAAQLPFAGAIIVLLLVWQFNSVRRASIVLGTIPLGLIGVTIGLLVARSS